MIESFAFQARARTIDHLGREQIADCPTAVSELWKNAYDAYSRNVSLNIYDGKPCIATIVDDGHGMDRIEFFNRWLVVGTESKTNRAEIPEEDRHGLRLRIKQGQKGIGRLSSANLGPLLLVVSKRELKPFISALIDWRLFENPYLYLADIEIPIAEFNDKSELLALLPDLFDRLMGNVWGSGGETKSERDLRVEEAWDRYSDLELLQGKSETTQSKIEGTVIHTMFQERHFSQWPLWRGVETHGTVLAVSDIQFDLEAQLSTFDSGQDSAVRQARDNLFQTLANFTDPFLDQEERNTGFGTVDFSATVTVWEGELQRKVIDENHPFDLQALLNLEHVVDGEFDESGKFIGRIKAFGTWLDGEASIPPAIDVATKKESFVGPFHFRIGTFEQQRSSTSHSDESFRYLEEQAEKYSGLAVYRNGLRVLPYGREGNDFFGIEKRRTKHAGREFWSLRRLFGRVALRNEFNPNLRDKAGREGLIDNRAAKAFRDLVENILKTTARNYFGSDADLRNKAVPDRKEEHKKKKAEEARNKQRAQNRKKFRANLEAKAPLVEVLLGEAEQLAENLRAGTVDLESDVLTLRATLQSLKDRYQESSLGEAPRSLGTLEERYLRYRKDVRRSKELLDSISDSLDSALEKLKPKSTKELALSVLNTHASFLHKRLRVWAVDARTLLESELSRIAELHAERNKVYHAKMLPLVDDIEAQRIPLREAAEEFERVRNEQDEENAELFEPYIAALNSLRERIDLAGLARFSFDQADELREEVDRLHGLAQLGITVEIIGHEIEGLEQTISSALATFPASLQASESFLAVKHGHEALLERLRFLSPLKLSGPKSRDNLTGKVISAYVQQFFGNDLSSAGIELEATPAFLSFSIFEQPARIFPVFINLINNAAYWVNHSNSIQKRILLDVVARKVVVADSGPGVDEEDRKSLFRLFFTRKVRGGRGVGLYLCRANLAAGGHTIEYGEKGERVLAGANFVIDFKGARYG